MIIDILNELAATDSINEKKAIMEREKGNDLLKRVFIMAYSKRFNYGIKKWPEVIESRGTRTLDEGLDFFEQKLATRVYTGHEAIRQVGMLIHDVMFSQKGEEEVLRRVMMRDLECGTGPTIANKIWKNCIPEQPQMLASSYDEKLIEKHIKWPAFAQLKADGARCFAEVTDDGVKFFSRAGNEYQGLHKLAKELMIMTEDARKRHPSGVMIDGELVYHAPKVEPKADNDLFGMFEEEMPELSKAAEFQNVDRSTSNGLANKSLKGTISQVEASEMKLQAWDYVPLDVVYSEGEKPGFAYDVRFRALEIMISEAVVLHGFDSVILIENQIVHNLKEAREVYKKYVDMKLEGIILKNIGSFWENKRSKNLIKFKEVIDIAMEIVGFYPHSKDPNKLGGVELKSLCGKITSDCGSGFKDTTRVKVKGKWVDIPIDERDEMDRERLMKEALEGNLVGRIADCECNGWVHSKGRDGTVGIFLPIIKGFRFDKTSADTFEDVFGSWDQTGL
ncbi:ATP-dependent DNA ligase [Edwardsiella phage PEi20]|uniref:DNA ligase n=1 Tax=Edwardsiella phage PEi20 TaxID=1608310 RepID=A0A0B6VST6_9CAUD|nr:ATP-dependent DNA ligase [Edwardsiella phage PEi20]BAQ22865.1 DNA ligase [Edwardsiella phage PEi20]